IHTQTYCPQCFSLYRTDNTPSQCSFRATPKSQLCESLLLVSTHQQGDKTNAKPGNFVFQSLVEWLGMFLNCPGIEEHLESLLGKSTRILKVFNLLVGCLIRPTITSPIEGRIIRVRLGPVVCDLPAIRKILGLAGHSSARHLCQFCN
ncbi:hypothetical protein VP01_10376g1, partial [Puccinia sorghi]